MLHIARVLLEKKSGIETFSKRKFSSQGNLQDTFHWKGNRIQKDKK